MIRIFALNISENILNKFNNLEVHRYYDKICIPVATIWKDDKLIYTVKEPTYDRINTCILELGG